MLSASGSAKCSLPAESVAVVNAVLWLPDDLNEMVASIIEKEEDLAHASGLQRCLQSSFLSLELCFLLRRGAYFQKNEGLNLDGVEKSREMKGRKIKQNKNQEI